MAVEARQRVLESGLEHPVDCLSLPEQRDIVTGDADADEWRKVLDVALRFATDCANTYRNASNRTKTRLNNAVLDRIEVRDSRVVDVQCREPFALLFNTPKFQLAHQVGLTVRRKNPAVVEGQPITLDSRLTAVTSTQGLLGGERQTGMETSPRLRD